MELLYFSSFIGELLEESVGSFKKIRPFKGIKKGKSRLGPLETIVIFKTIVIRILFFFKL